MNSPRDSVFQSWTSDDLTVEELGEPLLSCRLGENQ